jgi:hypothetical protein
MIRLVCGPDSNFTKYIYTELFFHVLILNIILKKRYFDLFLNKKYFKK